MENIRQLYDLVEVASAYGAELRRVGWNLYAGSCPICNDGDDRFSINTTDNHWYCRKAHDEGLHHPYAGDALDLVCAVENVPVKSGLQLLRSKNFHQAQPMAVAALKTKPQNAFDVDYWIGANNKFQNEFINNSIVMEYMSNRGFRFDVLNHFGIGAGYRQGIQAITIPWYDRFGGLIGGKYRLLDGAQRYAVWRGSNIMGCLFGWQSHGIKRKQALFLCEGELNAVSILQALNYEVDVLSTGSQHWRLNDDLAAQIGQWERVYLWTDGQTTLDQWRKAIGANVKCGWTSPIVKGQKLDANSMLLSGELYGFIVASAQKAG